MTQIIHGKLIMPSQQRFPSIKFQEYIHIIKYDFSNKIIQEYVTNLFVIIFKIQILQVI